MNAGSPAVRVALAGIAAPHTQQDIALRHARPARDLRRNALGGQGLTIRGHESPRRFYGVTAAHLLEREAEDALGRGVGEQNRTVRRMHGDALGHGPEYRPMTSLRGLERCYGTTQGSVPFLDGLAERIANALELHARYELSRDVGDRHHDELDLAAFTAQRHAVYR